MRRTSEKEGYNSMDTYPTEKFMKKRYTNGTFVEITKFDKDLI